MTVSDHLRSAAAVVLALLLSACSAAYEASGKVAVAERSWQRGGVQHVMAHRYRATLRFSESTSVLTEYAAGTLTMDGMTFPPGCHFFEVREGDTLRLDVSGLKMSVPGQSCSRTLQ